MVLVPRIIIRLAELMWCSDIPYDVMSRQGIPCDRIQVNIQRVECGAISNHSNRCWIASKLVQTINLIQVWKYSWKHYHKPHASYYYLPSWCNVQAYHAIEYKSKKKKNCYTCCQFKQTLNCLKTGSNY